MSEFKDMLQFCFLMTWFMVLCFVFIMGPFAMICWAILKVAEIYR